MELVRYERSEGISSITLDDGKANVLSPPMFRALNEAFDRAEGAFKIWVNEVHIGMTVPRFAIETCRQRLAPSRFHRAVVTAELHTPRQALEAGFLDELVPANELLETARQKALALAALGRSDYVATKRRAHDAPLQLLREAIEQDIEDWKRAFSAQP